MGAAFGWRATFVLGGCFGALALLAIRWLPRVTLDRPPSPRGLFTPAVLRVLVVTVFAVAGNLAFQTYLATFLAGLAGVTPALLGVLLVVAGMAGILGARLAGTVIDKIGARAAFVTAATAFTLVMAVFVCWVTRPTPLWLTVALLVAWSAAAWAVPPAIQALVLAKAGAHATAAMAVTSSTVYLGAAAGGAAGGLLIGVTPGAIPLLSGCCMIVAVGITRTKQL